MLSELNLTISVGRVVICLFFESFGNVFNGSLSFALKLDVDLMPLTVRFLKCLPLLFEVPVKIPLPSLEGFHFRLEISYGLLEWTFQLGT